MYLFGELETTADGRQKVKTVTKEMTPSVSFEEQYEKYVASAVEEKNIDYFLHFKQRGPDTRHWTKEMMLEEGLLDSYDEYKKKNAQELEIMSGRFWEHVGYGPKWLGSDAFDLKKGKHANVEYSGSGEMGKILLDFEWNIIESENGWAEAAKPLYDQKLWSENGFIEPLTLRSAIDIGMQVVGAVVYSAVTAAAGTFAGAAVQWLLNTTDDLLFAVMDTTLTKKDNKDVWADFGKKATVNAVSTLTTFGMNAVGSGTVTSVAAKMGITYTSSVASSYIGALDFRTGEMDWAAANSSWYSVGTIAATLSAGVTAGIEDKLPGALGLSQTQQENWAGVLSFGASLVSC